MGVAVVTDASAAYLQRQGLDNLADGAALAGADLGAAGDDVYTGGLGDGRLAGHRGRGRAAVQAYLQRAGAHAKYPGLAGVRRRRPATQTVRVRLTAPLHLPLKVPGGQESALIGATGARWWRWTTDLTTAGSGPRAFTGVASEGRGPGGSLHGDWLATGGRTGPSLGSSASSASRRTTLGVEGETSATRGVWVVTMGG